MMSDDNRRASFRMDDLLRLRLRILDEHLLADIEKDFNSYRIQYCLKSQILNQQQGMLPKLQKIRRKDQDLAEYMEHLEKQLVTLADRLVPISESQTDLLDKQTNVNLSATGLRFSTDLPLTEGQCLEVGMVLSTSALQVVVLADVVRVEKTTGSKLHSVSLYFSRIHEEDTESIIRHLAKLQQLELQSRRAE